MVCQLAIAIESAPIVKVEVKGILIFDYPVGLCIPGFNHFEPKCFQIKGLENYRMAMPKDLLKKADDLVGKLVIVECVGVEIKQTPPKVPWQGALFDSQVLSSPAMIQITMKLIAASAK